MILDNKSSVKSVIWWVPGKLVVIYICMNVIYERSADDLFVRYSNFLGVYSDFIL